MLRLTPRAVSPPVGMLLGLNIVLGDEPFEVRGVVAWSNPRASELGVRFVDLSQEAGSRIEGVVWLLAAAS